MKRIHRAHNLFVGRLLHTAVLWRRVSGAATRRQQQHGAKSARNGGQKDVSRLAAVISNRRRRPLQSAVTVVRTQQIAICSSTSATATLVICPPVRTIAATSVNTLPSTLADVRNICSFDQPTCEHD
uniref:Secreted protein n=1 Tax=Plectus sambesii TaxID=2011161 RepID=A0A914UIM8_9BILA